MYILNSYFNFWSKLYFKCSSFSKWSRTPYEDPIDNICIKINPSAIIGTNATWFTKRTFQLPSYSFRNILDFVNLGIVFLEYIDIMSNLFPQILSLKVLVTYHRSAVHFITHRIKHVIKNQDHQQQHIRDLNTTHPLVLIFS